MAVNKYEVENFLNSLLDEHKRQLLLMQDIAYLFSWLAKNDEKKSKWTEKRLKRIRSVVTDLYMKIGYYENIQKKINKKEEVVLPRQPRPFKLRTSEPKANGGEIE